MIDLSLGRIAQHLADGLLAASRADDLIDLTRPCAVPTAYLTDGVWIWTEAAAYYVISYGIAPEENSLITFEPTGIALPSRVVQSATRRRRN